MVIQAPREASRNEGVDSVHITDATDDVGGPWPARRQLLTTVVKSIQVYGTTYLDCIFAYLVDKHTGAVQCKLNLRIISGWRTLSRAAANVLSGVPPFRLLALDRKEIWVEQDEYRRREGHLPEEERNIIRRSKRDPF